MSRDSTRRRSGTVRRDAAQMYVDARAQRIYGGANEVMKDLIARAL